MRRSTILVAVFAALVFVLPLSALGAGAPGARYIVVLKNADVAICPWCAGSQRGQREHEDERSKDRDQNGAFFHGPLQKR